MGVRLTIIALFCFRLMGLLLVELYIKVGGLTDVHMDTSSNLATYS